LLVKLINKLKAPDKPPEAPGLTPDQALLTEIRDLLKNNPPR
jgi:large-conductance mechanosensitive channel